MLFPQLSSLFLRQCFLPSSLFFWPFYFRVRLFSIQFIVGDVFSPFGRVINGWERSIWRDEVPKLFARAERRWPATRVNNECDERSFGHHSLARPLEVSRATRANERIRTHNQSSLFPRSTLSSAVFITKAPCGVDRKNSRARPGAPASRDRSMKLKKN